MDMQLDQQAREPQHASPDADSHPAHKDASDTNRWHVSEADVFSQIMRVVSETMNGSLAEIGCYPSLGNMLKELREQNRQFYDVSQKLHADNTTMQRTIESQEQLIHKLRAELDAYRREFHRVNESLRQVANERDAFAQYARMAQNGLPNGPQQVPPQMMPPQPFASSAPVPVHQPPGNYFHGPTRIPTLYNGGTGFPSPDMTFNIQAMAGATPTPMIQGYHMPEPGMQPPRGMPRQVTTTAIIPTNAGPSSRPSSRPPSRPASRRSSESATPSNAGPPGQQQQRPTGLGTIRITPPTSAGGLGTIRIAPAQAAGPHPPSAPPPTVVDLTADAGGDATPGEEPTRKRRRVTLTLREPAPPAQEPPLDMATLGEQLSQVARSITPAESASAPAAASVAPAAGEPSDEEEDDDDDRDADGLVRVDVCIKIAFENKEGKMWCKMCSFRNVKAMTDAPPEPMPTTEPEDLAKHLEDVHPAGWKRLRGIS